MVRGLEILASRIVSGYLPGMQQPAAVFELRVDKDWLGTLRVGGVEAALRRWLETLPRATDTQWSAPLLGEWFFGVVKALHEQAQSPVLSRHRQQCHEEADHWRLVLFLPSLGLLHTAPNLVVAWLVRVLNRNPPHLTVADTDEVERLLQMFQVQAPQGGLTERLLRAAVERDIPWLHLCNNVYQFGWSSRGRLLDATFTDATSNIATRMARHKYTAAHVLRSAGLPVPRHQVAANANDAVRKADRLGYPVVIKPVDQDGARGVAAGLRNADAVRKAYAEAQAWSGKILVEEHIAGRDYRVYVMHGEVIWVLLRVPGGVTGDGKRSVSALLEEVNAEPRRQGVARRIIKIELDTEALELLEERQLGPESVPAAGLFVPLRRTANITRGGSPVIVPLAQVHPDNLLLCERAARLLRLDVAGVDLLIPDIGNSWLEGGAAICEVNAQPLLPPQLPAMILERLVRGNGRVPVLIVLDLRPGPGWLAHLCVQLAGQGEYVGFANPDEVTSGGQLLYRKPQDCAHAAGMLLRDPQVSLLVFQVTDAVQLANGAPVDRCDILVLSDFIASEQDQHTVLAALCATAGHIVVNRASAAWRHWQGPQSHAERKAERELAPRIQELLAELPGQAPPPGKAGNG